MPEYLRESIQGFKDRAKDLLFYNECEDMDKAALLADAMQFVEDVEDFFHHIAIVYQDSTRMSTPARGYPCSAIHLVMKPENIIFVIPKR